MLGCRQAGGQGASTAPIPLRVGQLWELGPQALLAPALAHHPGTLTGPIGDLTCSPSFRWGPHIFVASGPPSPPLHTHMKALHTHLHPPGPLHTLVLLYSQSSAPSLHPPPHPSPSLFHTFTFSSSHIPHSVQSLSGQRVTFLLCLTCTFWPHVVVLYVVLTLSLMHTH